jgi:hypothetical protein
MRVLLDHNVPRGMRRLLPGHDVRTTREMGWERLRNGLLLASAAREGFDVLLTLDKKVEHEQNLTTLPVMVVVLDAVKNTLPVLVSFVPPLSTLLTSPVDRALYVIGRDGSVLRLTQPR